MEEESVYRFRKELKKLKKYSGSGTELISVYIPVDYPIHETTTRLRTELGQASNIKSKSTKNNVSDALEKIINHLKLYNKPPKNGICLFAGNVSDNPAKTDIELFYFEPPFPLRINIYRCDSRFFLEPLEKIMDTRDSYGIVVMDGREATIAMVKGTEVTILKKLNSMAHAKIRKGGQCLSGDTLIFLEDGELKEIKDFEKETKVVGLDFQEVRTKPANISDFFITSANNSVIIKTKWPLCEIRATPYHRFFVLSEHGIKEKFAKDLDENDRLIIAKKINCNESEVEINYRPKTRIILNEKERMRLKEARIMLGLSQKKTANAVGFSQMIISYLERGKQTPTDENLQNIYKLYGLKLDQQLSKECLKIPEYWNEPLARLCGIICGDGSEDGNRIIIYEGKKEIVDNYCALIEKTIGVKPVVRIVDKTKQKGSFAKKPYYEIRIYSLEFVNVIKNIAKEIISRERDIPREITKCKNKVIAAFLSGLYDAEGYINKNRADIAMTSRKLLQKVQLLLLRLGILSSFSEKTVKGNKQWCVSISDQDSLNRFREQINFTRNDKREKLRRACERKGGQQYTDQIPIDGREVYKLAKELGLKTSDFHASSCFFRNKKPLGRKAFSKNILSVFEKHRNSERGMRIYEYLQRVYSSNITTATIKEKIHVQNREKFYDITIPVHSNFIANGFVVHNSSRRFERLREESIDKYYIRIGESMDMLFVGKGLKGVVVGGPGPTKEFFIKAKPFNYQTKILGVVDTGYTEEYGVREVLAKSGEILAEQEAVKEKIIVDRFIKEVVKGGLATYGLNEVLIALRANKISELLVSEGLTLKRDLYKCSQCNIEKEVIDEENVETTAPECENCKIKMNKKEEESLIDHLIESAQEKGIKIMVLSTDTAEGIQFLQGFGGMGAFLKYK